MLSDIGAVGFWLAGASYLAVATVLLIGYRGRRVGFILLLAVGGSCLWGVALGAMHVSGAGSPEAFAAVDALRLAGWYAALLWLIGAGAPRGVARALTATACGVVAGVILTAAALQMGWLEHAQGGASILAVMGLLGAVTGLALVELIHRNATPEGRWALKYLSVALGTVFVYDLFLFSDALLMRGSDTGIWAGRGYVSALVAPLVAVAAARNPQWALDVYVSRRFVLHTAAVAAAGGYLVVMAAVGYSIRVYGGVWGEPLQAVFLAGSLIVLVIALFSGQVRAKARVLLSKHFYNYRYDYRDEWLRFTRTVCPGEAETPLSERVIQAVAQVLDCPGGQLWQRGKAVLEPSASWNLPHSVGGREEVDGPVARLLGERAWVLDVDEWRANPGRYAHIPIPEWLLAIPRAWLVVPLILHERLEGFIVLTESRAGRRSANWEDCDLLKVVGRQSASYLAQDEAARALSRAQQFEAFNQLSAFVVHDLKNIIGQLSMLAANARRHAGRPEFLADAVETIEQAVVRMNRLMQELRNGRAGAKAAPEPVELGSVVEEVASACAVESPVPVVELPGEALYVRAERDRLAAALSNVIQNAQEATAADGEVRVALRRDGDRAAIEVTDTGSGMTPSFVQQRLFRPFDTSKAGAGMGIGAFEAREFARALGGELEVDSVPGAGTRFRFLLPGIARCVARVDSDRIEENAS